MKHIFTSLSLAAMCCLGAQAQVDTLMRVSRTDGATQYIPITQIKNVDFVEVQPWEDPTPGKNTFEDYFNIKVTRCERIADVLIMEFDIENRKPVEYTLTFDMWYCGSEDDLGNSYGVKTECAFGKQGFSHNTRTVILDPYETVKGKMRVVDFDTTNKAARITIKPKVSIEDEKLDVNTVTIKSKIADNRLSKKAVQTCDKNLLFDVKSCERVGNALILEYDLTNTGTQDIEDLKFDAWYCHSTDDLGNNYSVKTGCAFDKSDYSNAMSISLEAGSTIRGRFRVSEMDKTDEATEINIYPKVTSTDYILEDDAAKFMRIPITDNRVLSHGIKSCDRNLDFKVVKCWLQNHGNEAYPSWSAYIKFDITNTGTKDVHNFYMDTWYCTSNDDLDNNYGIKTDIAYTDQEYATNRWAFIAAGKTVSATIRLREFDPTASYISVFPKVSADNYVLDDPTVVSFQQIPIEK